MQAEIDQQLEKSKRLVEPAPKTDDDMAYYNVPEGKVGQVREEVNRENSARFLAAHGVVQEAVKRITHIDNGSSKDRFRINVERCIDTFGRHETDQTLPSRLLPTPLGPGGAPLTDHATEVIPSKERKGPDTGSSEVQIAILTAKIRNLANHLERVGNSDKINKRNLRLLVHRRQKLLQYLRRKERAGPRWQRCIDTLGLTEGTWRGEITL
jgi:ribosomal protein S15